MPHTQSYQLEGMFAPIDISHGAATMGTDLVLSARAIQALNDDEIIKACRWFARHHLEITIIEQARSGDPENSLSGVLTTIENSTQDPVIKQAAREALDQRIQIPEHTTNPQAIVQVNKPGYVYLIQSGTLYKIGTTTDLAKRLRFFITTLPLGAELLWSTPADNPRALESELHTQFVDKCVNGEWFKLDSADVDYIRSLT